MIFSDVILAHRFLWPSFPPACFLFFTPRLLLPALPPVCSAINYCPNSHNSPICHKSESTQLYDPIRATSTQHSKQYNGQSPTHSPPSSTNVLPHAHIIRPHIIHKEPKVQCSFLCVQCSFLCSVLFFHQSHTHSHCVLTVLD